MQFDFAARRARALAAARLQVDAGCFLVTNVVDVWWLTGFSGSNGAVLITDSYTLLATDGRYQNQAATEAPDVEIVVERAVATALVQQAGLRGLGAVAFQSEQVSLAAYESLFGIGQTLATTLLPVGDVISGLRTVKEPGELALISRACNITSNALESLLPEIEIGMAEVELARRLELRMAELGADDRAFATIVASGPNSAIPHHQPTQRVLEVGDLLKIDFGARYQGYHADCTRTFVVAADPSQWQREVHAVVDAAADAGRQAARSGASFADVDAAARNLIADAGYGEFFSHGLGHGVGLEIHESPLLAATSLGTLEPGVVATIEPGVYLPGRGGVRIEDCCLVTTDSARILTRLPRELARVG